MPLQAAITDAISSFKKDKSKQLTLSFSPEKILELDEYLPRASCQNPPTLHISPSIASSVAARTFVAVILDISAPFVSSPIFSPILHWIQPNLVLLPDPTSANSTQMIIKDGGKANFFVAPAPPPLSGPHRYVVLLYEQPEGLDGAESSGMGMWARVRWDFEGWMAKVGLKGEEGKGLIAGGAWMSN